MLEGDTTLQVFTVFGNTALVVPGDWNVTVTGTETFGDVSVPWLPHDPAGPTQTLRVVTIFGDVKVRHDALVHR